MATLKTKLRAFTAKQLASGLGVSERTARRYRAKGKLPPDRVEAFSDWTAEHTAPRRTDEKRLLNMSAADLAAFADVRPRTARGWQRRGEIPTRTKAKLLTGLKPAVEPKQVRRGVVKTFEGRISQGRYFKTRVEGEVAPGTLSKVAAWIDKAPTKRKRGRNYQIVARVKSDLALDETMPERAYFIAETVTPSEKGVAGQHTIASNAYATKEKAMREFMSDMRSIEGFDVEMLDVSVIERDHWK